MSETTRAGKFYRILSNASTGVWDRISFWKKASDVEFNDGTTMEKNKPFPLIKRSTAYSVGAIGYISTAPSWAMLKCTTAGTTAATAPSYSSITAAGGVVTDGTAKFTAIDKRPSGTLSTSNYIFPTTALASTVNAKLAANGKNFQFSYSNGKYGITVDGTFIPF